MSDKSVVLRKKLFLPDEDDYIERVYNQLTVLTLLTDHEESIIRKGGDIIAARENFFELVFTKIFNENSSLKKTFDGLEHVGADEVINHKMFKNHNVEVARFFKTIIDNVRNLFSWIMEMFKIVCIHKLYMVENKHINAFMNTTKAQIMALALTKEDFKDELEKVLDKFFYCIIEIMNPFVDVKTD